MLRRVAAWLILVTPLSAQDSASARNNLAHELAICGSFFSLVSEAPGLPDSSAKTAMDKSAILIEASIAMSDSALAMARYEMALQDMIDEMKDWSRLSVILNKHGRSCPALFDDPMARFNYFLNRKPRSP